MDQFQNGMLNVLQGMMNQLLPGKPNAKSESVEDSEFQKLMERAQNPQDVEQPQPAKKPQSAQEQKETPKAQAPQKESAQQQAPVKSQALEETAEQERMLMVAMQTLQNPQIVEDTAVLTENGPEAAVVLAELPVDGQNLLQADAQPQIQNQAEGLLEDVTAELQGEAAPQEEFVQTVETAAAAGPEAEVQTQQPSEQRAERIQVETAPEEAAGEDDAQTADMDAAGEMQTVFRDLEAAPIKVSDTAAMPEENSQTPDVRQQVEQGLVRALAQGESRVQIDLTPEHLGSVRVEITHTADGALHVVLNAENHETRSLLSRHTEQLQNILAGQGRGADVQVEVQRPPESQQHQQQQGQYEGHKGHPQQEQEPEQRRRRQEHSEHPQDFLHQLRLGLVSTETE